jgi:hypothetical protein
MADQFNANPDAFDFYVGNSHFESGLEADSPKWYPSLFRQNQEYLIFGR